MPRSGLYGTSQERSHSFSEKPGAPLGTPSLYGDTFHAEEKSQIIYHTACLMRRFWIDRGSTYTIVLTPNFERNPKFFA